MVSHGLPVDVADLADVTHEDRFHGDAEQVSSRSTTGQNVCDDSDGQFEHEWCADVRSRLMLAREVSDVVVAAVRRELKTQLSSLVPAVAAAVRDSAQAVPNAEPKHTPPRRIGLRAVLSGSATASRTSRDVMVDDYRSRGQGTESEHMRRSSRQDSYLRRKSSSHSLNEASAVFSHDPNVKELEASLADHFLERYGLGSGLSSLQVRRFGPHYGHSFAPSSASGWSRETQQTQQQPQQRSTTRDGSPGAELSLLSVPHHENRKLLPGKSKAEPPLLLKVQDSTRPEAAAESFGSLGDRIDALGLPQQVSEEPIRLPANLHDPPSILSDELWMKTSQGKERQDGESSAVSKDIFAEGFGMEQKPRPKRRLRSVNFSSQGSHCGNQGGSWTASDGTQKYVRNHSVSSKDRSTFGEKFKTCATSDEVLNMRVTDLTHQIPQTTMLKVVPCLEDQDDEQEVSDHRSGKTEESGEGPDEELDLPPSPFLFRAFGILPNLHQGGLEKSSMLRARIWQWVLQLFATLCCVLLAMSTLDSLMYKRRFGVFSDLPWSAFACCALASVGVARSSTTVFEVYVLLQAYSLRAGKLERWRSSLFWDKTLSIALWVFAVLARWLAVCGTFTDSKVGQLYPEDHTFQDCAQVAAFAVTTAVILSLVLFIHHTCRALSIMLDTFCCQTVFDLHIDEATHQWNVLQAVLRKASGAIELCFCFFMASGVLAMPILVVDVMVLGPSWEVLPALLPTCIIILAVLRLLFSAAAVTEKCDHVPSVINSLCFDKEEEEAIRALVQYIINSAAGFIVFGARVTQDAVLRCSYVSSMIAFALATNTLSRT